MNRYILVDLCKAYPTIRFIRMEPPEKSDITNYSNPNNGKRNYYWIIEISKSHNKKPKKIILINPITKYEYGYLDQNKGNSVYFNINYFFPSNSYSLEMRVHNSNFREITHLNQLSFGIDVSPWGGTYQDLIAYCDEFMESNAKKLKIPIIHLN